MKARHKDLLLRRAEAPCHVTTMTVEKYEHLKKPNLVSRLSGRRMVSVGAWPALRESMERKALFCGRMMSDASKRLQTMSKASYANGFLIAILRPQRFCVIGFVQDETSFFTPP